MIWVIGVGLVTAVGINQASELSHTMEYAMTHRGRTPDKDLFEKCYKSRGPSLKGQSSPSKDSHGIENWLANKIKGVL